jgi:hypothetical protein
MSFPLPEGHSERILMQVKAALLRLGMMGTAAVVPLTILLTATSVVPAGAATETTPTTPNTNCSASTVVAVGGSLTYQVTCLFAPNAAVAVAADGSSYGTGTADPSGVFTENIVVSADPEVTMNGGPGIPVQFGDPTAFVATGLNPQGGTNDATTMVDTPAPGAAAATLAAATSSTAPLAFTGADLAAAVIGGLVLLALGTIIVLYARRRSGRRFSVARPGPG